MLRIMSVERVESPSHWISPQDSTDRSDDGPGKEAVRRALSFVDVLHDDEGCQRQGSKSHAQKRSTTITDPICNDARPDGSAQADRECAGAHDA